MSSQRRSSWSARVEAAYHTESRELWALFYAQCCDADRALEAVQEAFTRLLEQNGEPIRDIRAWLIQVGRNWLRDVARRRKVAARSADYLDDLAGRQEEPLSVLVTRERQAQVRTALGELKLEDREVLVLRYSLSWSSLRIAEALNVSPAAVDMRLSRARRRLSEILEKAGIDHERL